MVLTMLRVMDAQLTSQPARRALRHSIFIVTPLPGRGESVVRVGPLAARLDIDVQAGKRPAGRLSCMNCSPVRNQVASKGRGRAL
jgi:hypothetical protein